MDLSMLFEQALAVVREFKDEATLVGLALLVNLLVNVTKLSVVEKFFSSRKWVRPVVAVVLGVGGAVVAALTSGESTGGVAAAGLTGALVGAGAVGVHELWRSAKVVWLSLKEKFSR